MKNLENQRSSASKIIFLRKILERISNPGVATETFLWRSYVESSNRRNACRNDRFAVHLSGLSGPQMEPVKLCHPLLFQPLPDPGIVQSEHDKLSYRLALPPGARAGSTDGTDDRHSRISGVLFILHAHSAGKPTTPV